MRDAQRRKGGGDTAELRADGLHIEMRKCDDNRRHNYRDDRRGHGLPFFRPENQDGQGDPSQRKCRPMRLAEMLSDGPNLLEGVTW